MAQSGLYAALVAILVASFGLWWFRLVLTGVRKLPKTSRYGVYALVWFAYFILTLIIIGQTA